MKLRNKKTGEIVSLEGELLFDNEMILLKQYSSLAELNAEWEDYEEPKEYYYLNEYLELDHEMWTGTEFDNKLKAIGNYFETKEQAKKAVEKLKAWERLKDKGFRFLGNTYETDKRYGSIFYKVDEDTYSEDIVDDLDLLFSGGEE